MRYYWFLLLFILNNTFLMGTMMQTEKIEDLHQLWEGLDESSLIVFDIDDVIISTEDHFAHPYGYLTFIALTNQALERATTEEEKQEIMRKVSLSQILAKRKLVEETMPEFIRGLQKAGIKVIALTNFPRGQYGSILRTETWRIEQLKSFGVDFSMAFPHEGSHEFQELIKQGLASPLYENGILFANDHPKGEVLKAFFKKSQFYPSKVIFIDDLLHHHTSVKNAVESLNIPFIGVHYVGASKHFGTCNEELLRFQFDHLLSTSNWLSDQHILEQWRQKQTFD